MKLRRPVYIIGGAHTVYLGKGHPDFVRELTPARRNPTVEDHLHRAIRELLASTGGPSSTFALPRALHDIGQEIVYLLRMRIIRIPRRSVLLLLLLIFSMPSPARGAVVGQDQLPRRVALVIGNQDYPGKGTGQRGAVWGELRAPRNDARRIAEKLARPPLGFKVTLLLDQKRGDLQRALEKFYKDIRQADVALFYFSGHGFSTGGQSYLVPIDVLDRDPGAGQQPPKFTEVQRLAAEIKARARYGLVFLDACRDEAEGGFVRIEGIPSLVAGKGQIIVSYAAPLGRRANDARAGDNSPYTAALLQHIDKPDLSLYDLFSQLGRSLAEFTRDRRAHGEPHQEHQFAGGIQDVIYLAGQTDQGVLETVRRTAKLEQDLWDDARRGRDRTNVWHYMRRYPEGRFASAALALLDDLDWGEARQRARRDYRQPILAYLTDHPQGSHRKEALDWLKPVWKKPAFWLSLGAGVLAAGAVAVGVGVKVAADNQPEVLMPEFPGMIGVALRRR